MLKQTVDGQQLRITIQAPCEDIAAMVASAMRRAPDVVEFMGFDQHEARIVDAVAQLRNTGHTVVFA